MHGRQNVKITMNLKYTEHKDGLWAHTSLGRWLLGGCCQYGNANSDYVQGGEFLNQKSNH